eukprot:6185443-Pleurochrysis_carterae.AAC.1
MLSRLSCLLSAITAFWLFSAVPLLLVFSAAAHHAASCCFGAYKLGNVLARLLARLPTRTHARTHARTHSQAHTRAASGSLSFLPLTAHSRPEFTSSPSPLPPSLHHCHPCEPQHNASLH